MSERPPPRASGAGRDRGGPAVTGGDRRGPGGPGGAGGAGCGWVVYLPPHRVRNQVEDFAQSGINSGGAELLSTVSIHTEGSRHALMGLSRALFQV